LVVAVYLLSVNNAWWPTPDSAMYQGLGKNLVEGRGYVFNGQAHTTVTPALPLILGGLRLAFGEGYWAPNLLMTLCGLGGLLLAWMSLRRLTDEWTALLAVVGCAACYKCFHYSHTILTDAPFFLLFWALTYASLRLLAGGRGWLAPVAVLAALALAVRAPGIIVLGPLSAALLLQKTGAAGLPRRVAAAAVVLAVPLLTAGALYLLAKSYSDQPSEYLTSTTVRVSLLTRLLYIPRSLPVIPGEIALSLTGQRIWVLGLAVLAPIVAGGVLLWRGGNRLAPAVCGLCLLVSAALAGPLDIRARYLLPIYPLLMIMGLYGVVWGTRRILVWRGRIVGPADSWKAAAIFIAVLLAINLPKVAREAFYYDFYSALTGRYYQRIEGGHYADLHSLAEFLRRNLPPGQAAAVRGDRASMLHLLSGARTVAFKKVDVWNPWNAEQAENVYADLRGRADLGVIIHDRGELDARFHKRLGELLAGDPNWQAVFPRERWTTIYVRRPSRPASQPATRPAG
jgi:hypothetical protein